MLGGRVALAPAFEDYAVPAAPVAVFGDNQNHIARLRNRKRAAVGQTVMINANWLALQPPDFDYNIFIHALDSADARQAQIDTQPLSGQRPMTTWRPGEVIADREELHDSALTPPLTCASSSASTIGRARNGCPSAGLTRWH